MLGLARRLECAEQSIERPPQSTEFVGAAGFEPFGHVGRACQFLDRGGQVVQGTDRGARDEPSENDGQGEGDQGDQQQRQAEVAQLLVHTGQRDGHLQCPRLHLREDAVGDPEGDEGDVLALLNAVHPHIGVEGVRSPGGDRPHRRGHRELRLDQRLAVELGGADAGDAADRSGLGVDGVGGVGPRGARHVSRCRHQHVVGRVGQCVAGCKIRAEGCGQNCDDAHHERRQHHAHPEAHGSLNT